MDNEAVEMLVLTDAAGNYYAIPRPTLDQHRVTGEQQAELQRLLGDEVGGYMLTDPYALERLSGERQAARLQEAERMRAARAARPAGDATPTGTGPGNWANTLVGTFVRMVPFKAPPSAGANP